MPIQFEFVQGPIHQQIVVPPQQPVAPPPIERPLQQPAERDLEETNKEKQFNAALELEMWKAEQEEQFQKELKQREKATLLKLSEEFAQREAEREGLISRRVAEYEKMEKAGLSDFAITSKISRISTKHI